MKKLTFLFALLCASVMSWAAIDWSSVEYLGSTNAAISMNTYKYAVDTEAGEVGPNSIANIQGRAGGDGFYSTYGQAVTSCSHDAEILGDQVWVYVSQLTAKDTKITVTLADASTRNFHLWYKDGVEGGESSKPSPELSLNVATKTLEIEASAETFQIVPTKEVGSGAVSYSSNAEGVATVSNTGLITAVGAGTATITVSVAENEDFAADSKTITVEVIDWPNTPWLTNSNDSYKLHISPAFVGDYGGQRIDGSNLWVGFPSAEFGACSIDYTALGAGVSFPLSNFTSSKSQFTMVCQGTTYTFTVYRKFDGVNLAKGMPTYAGATALPKAEANDGNKGSRWASGGGAKHYAVYKDMAEDWWTVDLGAFYEITSIKTLFEGATPKNYSFYISPNNDSWIEIDSYNHTPNVGNTDENYNEYTYNPGKVGRYVKIFAREAVQADFAYGISIWEFEVYGQPAENVDVNAPVLASAAVSGTPTTTEIQIAVSASDTEDGTISLYRVRENSLNLDHNFVATDGKIAIDGLVDGMDYSFTITALDNIGNQSNAIVVNASTAVDPANPATMAPEPPARSADDVRAIYSDAYADILMHEFNPGPQWGSAAAVRRVKSGNNYLLYDMSSSDNITWGMNDGGANAIVAKDGYHAEGKTGLDASGMEYLHVDIWSLVALTKINVKINDDVFTTITHEGNGWQSYNLEMEGSSIDFTNIRWLKLDGITSSETRGKVAVDNYYFWKSPSGVKAVVVSSNNGLWGSATAKVAGEDVTSVATGTEVTFAATAETGYDFAYWQIGETKVYDNPYVVAVDANITAVATFEPARTSYCAVPVTNAQGHTIYLTINKTANVDEYKILFEGSANTRITNSHGNIQFRLTHVNGSDGEHQFAGGEWTVDGSGFGSVYTTFTATDYRAITITNTYIPLTTSNSGADEFNFPTNDASLIKWDATCADDEAPVLAAPVATPLSGTSVRLALSATDNMAALLTYAITYDGHATPIEVPGAAGETTYYNIKGLSAGTNYTFSVSVSDGTNVSAEQTCTATPSMPTALVPAHNEAGVLSVYSDKYESALEHDFIKNNWSGPTYSEQTIAGDHMLVYTSDPATQPQMPDVAWGENNDGANAIIAKDGYNDGTNKGLDVRHMKYIHFDMWSAVATAYPELYLNDTRVDGFALNGSGWQSFDIDITTLTDEQKTNIRWIKFIGLRTPNPEEIAIDNVYFWKAPDLTRNDSWMAPGELGTVCIPNGAVATGGDIYELVGKNADGKIVFATVTDNRMEPGKPYLFEAKSNRMDFFYTNDPPAGDPDNSGAMKGTFSAVTLTGAQLNNVYYFAGHALWGCTDLTESGLQVAANRAWVVIDENMPSASAAPKPGRRYITMNVNGKNVATGFEDVQSGELQCTKVLINGQLFIIRGQRYFDATGRLVK